MVFAYVDVASLIVWIIFVTWQRWPLSDQDISWYDQQDSRVPSYIFPIVWFILHGLIIASHFLFFHFAADYAGDWRFITSLVLSIVNLLCAQYWTLFFFKMRKFKIAFVVALVLFVTATVNVTIMGISSDIVGSLWALPMALYIPYVTWLAFACFLNYEWISVPQKKYPML